MMRERIQHRGRKAEDRRQKHSRFDKAHRDGSAVFSSLPEAGRELAVSVAVPIAIGISSQSLEIVNGWVSDASGSGEIGWGQVNMTSGSYKIASGLVNLPGGEKKVAGEESTLPVERKKLPGTGEPCRGRVNLACGVRQMRVSEVQYNTLCRHPELVSGSPANSIRFRVEPGMTAMNDRLRNGSLETHLAHKRQKYNPIFSCPPFRGRGGEEIKTIHLN